MPEAARAREAGADREAAAQALGQRHDVGRYPGPFVGEQAAGPPHAALHLVENQQEVVLVAQLPQLLEERRSGVRMPPSPWIGSIRMAAVSRADRRLDLRDVAERHAVEAGQNGPETFEMLLLAAGGDGRDRAAVKGALEGDDAVALGLAAPVVEPARHLDRAFQRLGAGVAEERRVGE